MSGSWASRDFFFRSNFETQPTLGSYLVRRTYANGLGSSPRDTSGAALRATYLLIGINTVVFAGWQYAEVTRDRILLQKLYDNFTMSTENWRAGRTWTIVTSAFSHSNFLHFFFNMYALRTFGTLLSWVPGISAFHVLTLSLGSGLAGSAAWLYQKQSTSEAVRDRRWGANAQSGMQVRQAALGASGIVMGAGAAAACLLPFAPMQLMFIPIPIPLWAVTALYAAVDTYFLQSDKSPIGHAAHLGGAIFGVGYYLGFLRGYGGIWRWLLMRKR